MSESMTTTTTETNLDLFRLPDAAASMDFSNEDLADDMEGMRTSFQRVKMPSGGALIFEVQTDNPEKPDYVSNLTGIIVHHHDANAYWPDGESADESVPPACSSTDGKIGLGVPGGICESCALNEYGSGEEGKGKACKNKRHIYLLRDGDFLPLLLQLPPTSLRPFSDFINQAFIYRHRASHGSVVELGLKKMDNGNLYSVATFRKVADFEGEKLAEVKAYVKAFKAQIKMHLQRKEEAPVTEPLEYGDYTAEPPAIGYPAGQQYDEVGDLPFGPPMDVQPVEDLPFGPPAGEQVVEDLPFGPPIEPQPAVAVAYAAAVPGVINGESQQLPA